MPRPDHSATIAVIAGGTQGLGLAIAEALVADGCTRLVIAGRRVAEGEAALQRLGGLGAEALYVPTDMGDPVAAVALVEAAAARFGRANALVNAAATTERGSILDCTIDDFDRHIAVNTRGPFFALQRFAQLAVAGRHPAAAVNILSMVVHCGQSYLAPYSASKAALANITKNAAQALRAHRIRVNGINCGWMDTPGEDETQRRFHGAQDGWLAAAEARQPMGMLVKPVHVAGMASYLLSDASGVMTGAVVDFDQNVAGAYPE
jgi:NAD(P)-dependent dehydrogenase (short-subunit alcohol dehydrogenase family)